MKVSLAPAAKLALDQVSSGPRTRAPPASMTASSDGSFSAVWQTNHIGRFAIRALVLSNAAQTASATPSMTLTVYRSSIASWYGGAGEYGRKTACGVKLTAHTIGVANKTLRCGTQVAVYYDGRRCYNSS